MGPEEQEAQHPLLRNLLTLSLHEEDLPCEKLEAGEDWAREQDPLLRRAPMRDVSSVRVDWELEVWESQTCSCGNNGIRVVLDVREWE